MTYISLNQGVKTQLEQKNKEINIYKFFLCSIVKLLPRVSQKVYLECFTFHHHPRRLSLLVVYIFVILLRL